MSVLQDFREQYPQYNEIDDETLAESLRKQYYPEMPVEDYRQKMGLGASEWKDYPRDPDGFKIDPTRPALKNDDGTISTERAIGIGMDGRTYNLPTIIDGEAYNPRDPDELDTIIQDARDKMDAGWKFPSFETIEEANAAAARRSDSVSQARDAYAKKNRPSVWDRVKSIWESDAKKPASVLSDDPGNLEAFDTPGRGRQRGSGRQRGYGAPGPVKSPGEPGQLPRRGRIPVPLGTGGDLEIPDEPRADLRDQLFAGFDEMKANRETMTAFDAIRTYRDADAIALGEIDPGTGRATAPGTAAHIDRRIRAQYLVRGTEEQRAAVQLQVDKEADEIRAEQLVILQDAIDTAADLRTRAEQTKFHKETKDMLEAETFSQGISEFADDPIMIIAETTLRSLPNMAEALPLAIAGAMVAGPYGFSGGMGVGAGVAEYRSAFSQYLQQQNIDINSAQELVQASENDDLMRAAHDYASTRSTIIGVFSAAGAGISTRPLTPFVKNMVGRELSNVSAQVIAQAGIEGSGEATAQIATTGVLEPGEILAEMTGSLSEAPIEVGVAAVTGIRAKTQQKRLQAIEEEVRKIFEPALGDDADPGAADTNDPAPDVPVDPEPGDGIEITRKLPPPDPDKPTQTERDAVKDIPTVEVIAEAIEIVGEEEFQSLVKADREKYGQLDGDPDKNLTDAISIENIARDIVAIARRKTVTDPDDDSLIDTDPAPPTTPDIDEGLTVPIDIQLAGVETALAVFPKDITELSVEKHGELTDLLKKRRNLIDQRDQGMTLEDIQEQREFLRSQLFEYGVSARKFATLDEMENQLTSAEQASVEADQAEELPPAFDLFEQLTVNVENFANELMQATVAHTQIEEYRVFDDEQVNIEFMPFANNQDIINIETIESLERGQGNGTAALTKILELADKHGVAVVVNPVASGMTDDSPAQEQLVKWYEDNGFGLMEDSDDLMIYRPPAREQVDTDPVVDDDGPMDFPIDDMPPEIVPAQLNDNLNVHYRQVESDSINVGLETVASSSDAAHIFSFLRKRGQEAFYVLVTDAAGKPVNLIRHTEGVKDSANVDPATVVAAAASTPGAANIWMGHNHPSGIMEPSQADQGITARIMKALAGTDIELKDHIIVGAADGRAMSFGAEASQGQIDITPARRNKRLAITTRQLQRRDPGDRVQLASPAQTREYVESIESRNAVIWMDNRNQVLGITAFDPGEMAALRDNGRVRRVLSDLDESNAIASIIISENADHAKNMAKMINGLGGIRVLDAIIRLPDGSIENSSELGQGIESAAGPFSSRQPVSRGTIDEQLTEAEQRRHKKRASRYQGQEPGEGGILESRQPGPGTDQPPAGTQTNTDQLQDLDAQYQEGDLTVQDLAEALRDMDDVPDQLVDAVNTYFDELADDFDNYGGRGDADAYGGALIAVFEEHAQASSQPVDRRQGGQPVGQDQRIQGRRDRLERMTLDELVDAYYTDPLTGIGNRAAFEEEVNDHAFLASIDADSLKWINDNLGHDAGDAMLKAIAEALNQPEVDAYRIGGDEFYIGGATRDQVQGVLTLAEGILSQQVISSPAGKKLGIDITSGIGSDKAGADSRMEVQKKRNKGRAGRGDTPSGVTLSNKTATVLDMEPGTNYVPIIGNTGSLPIDANNNLILQASGRAVRIPKKPIRREHIIAVMRKYFGNRIYFGRVSGGGRLGFYRPGQGEVRLKKHNDIEVAAHEIAHYLDDSYPWIKRLYTQHKDEVKSVSYDVKLIYEGWAEFVRLWMTQESEAIQKAPSFYDAFNKEAAKRDPKLWNMLIGLQELMHAWTMQGARARGASKHGSADPSFYERIRRLFPVNPVQAALDGLRSIKMIAADLSALEEPALQDAYLRLRLAIGGSNGVLEATMFYGTPGWRADKQGIEFTGEGLQDIFGKYWGNNEVAMYFIARRAQELKGQGRENLMRNDEIAAWLQLEDDIPGLRDMHDRYQAFNGRMLDFAEGAGILNDATRAAMEEMNQSYVPFHRVIESVIDGKSVRQGGNPFMRLTGGTQNINNIWDNIVNNTGLIIRQSMINDGKRAMYQVLAPMHQMGSGKKNMQAGVYVSPIPKVARPTKIMREQILRQVVESMGVSWKSYRIAKETGMYPEGEAGEFLEVVVAMVDRMIDGMEEMVQFWQFNQDPTGPNLDYYTHNGEKRWFEINDPNLMDTIRFMGPRPTNLVLQILGGFTATLRRGVVAVPVFQMKNFVRDTVNAYLLSSNIKVPAVRAMRVVMSRMGKDPAYQEMLLNGGGFANRSQGLNAQRKLVIDPTRLAAFYDRFMGRFENANRLAEYKAAIGDGESPRRAALLSREISTDFAMRGSSNVARFLAISVPFLNARAQGLYRNKRQFDTKATAISYAIRGLALTAATLALYSLNKDDERYKEMPEDIKDLYWVFFTGAGEDQYVLMPKPFESGMIFATLPERMMEFAEQENGKEFADALGWMFLQTFNMDMTPQAFQPELDLQRNKNFTGSPIIPFYLDNVEPGQQYTYYTSEAVRAAAQAAGISPIKMEYRLRGYLGTIGTYAIGASDAMVRAATDPEDRDFGEYPTRGETWRENILVKALIDPLVNEGPPRRTKYVTDLYDMLRESELVANTVALHQNRTINELEEYLSDPEKMVEYAVNEALNDARKQLGEIRVIMDKVRQSRDMSADEKRVQLWDLTRQRNAVARQAAVDIAIAQQAEEERLQEQRAAGNQ